ncbi:MAG: phosphodiester glycosidase family protein, partial [Opitutaceae bacterium]
MRGHFPTLGVLALIGALTGAVTAQPASAETLIPLPAGWRLASERMAGFPAEGLQLYTLESSVTRAFCLAWDTRSPSVAFKPVLGAGPRTPTQFAAADPALVFAAVNAGYFGGNQSFSLVQRDGAVLSPNIKAVSRPLQGASVSYYPTRAALGLSAAGNLAADWIYHVGAGNAQIHAYPAPSPNRAGDAPQPVPTAAFPAGGAPWVMQHALGGSPMLVRDGVVRITDGEELIDVNNTSRRPRTAMGFTSSGVLLTVVVEGDNPGGPAGMTLAEIAALMRALGCVSAINLDGGGSTAMTVGGSPTVRPGDGAERPVMSALLLTDPVRTVNAIVPPRLNAAPWAATVAAGAPFHLQVDADGGALSYQWSLNGRRLTGETRAALSRTRASAADAGEYAVTVRNALGLATSPPARVVVAGASPGELVNLAVRAVAGAGDDTLIVGFAVRGGAETILARGVGPGLAELGVPGVLEDPRLDLLSATGAVVEGNDDWLAAGVGPVAARVGAFPLTPGSRDAALVTRVAEGVHMVAATAARGAAKGSLLVEVYDTAAGGGTLGNLSARARVAGGGGELIAGFVVRGETAATLLVRAVGPSLGNFGLADALRAPRLTLMSGATPLAANAGWATAPNAAEARRAAERAGAFPLSGAAADSLLRGTLPPGAYTA